MRWRTFDQAIKARNADIPPEDRQGAIDEACAAVRSELWPKPANPA